jgi:hypothetical protein
VSDLDVDAIKKRLAATTPGDWKRGLYSFDGTASLIFCNHMVVASTDPQPHPSARAIFDQEHDSGNTEFIAHARADIEALLAELEKYKGDNRHKIELREDGFTIMHPLACRPNLFDCDYNFAARDTLSGGEVPNGVYYCSVNDEYLLEIEESIKVAPVS